MFALTGDGCEDDAGVNTWVHANFNLIHFVISW